MKFKHDKTKTTKILMYAHNPGGGEGVIHFQDFGDRKFRYVGIYYRKIYISVRDVLVHFRITKLKGFIR